MAMKKHFKNSFAKCPKCGSHDIEYQENSGNEPVQELVYEEVYVCEECNATFIERYKYTETYLMD